MPAIRTPSYAGLGGILGGVRTRAYLDKQRMDALTAQRAEAMRREQQSEQDSIRALETEERQRQFTLQQEKQREDAMQRRAEATETAAMERLKVEWEARKSEGEAKRKQQEVLQNMKHKQRVEQIQTTQREIGDRIAKGKMTMSDYERHRLVIAQRDVELREEKAEAQAIHDNARLTQIDRALSENERSKRALEDWRDRSLEQKGESAKDKLLQTRRSWWGKFVASITGKGSLGMAKYNFTAEEINALLEAYKNNDTDKANEILLRAKQREGTGTPGGEGASFADKVFGKPTAAGPTAAPVPAPTAPNTVPGPAPQPQQKPTTSRNPLPAWAQSEGGEIGKPWSSQKAFEWAGKPGYAVKWVRPYYKSRADAESQAELWRKEPGTEAIVALTPNEEWVVVIRAKTEKK